MNANSNRVCHRFFGGLVFVSALWAAQANALAPEHETRRLMLATEQAVQEERWGDAGEFLNRIQKLDASKPAAYAYYRGKVMLQSGHHAEAKSAFESYVESAGEEGEYYKDALRLITEVERQQKGKTANGNGNGNDRVAMIEPAGQGEPVDKLKQLYLADSDVEALKIHLNTLLEMAGWREEQRIVRAGAKPDILYRVSVGSGGELVIQESRRQEDSDVERRLSSQSLSVYGVDPSVNWDCNGVNQTCWVYDPRNGTRLFKLSDNRDRAAEVAQTLGRLIKTLQTPG